MGTTAITAIQSVFRGIMYFISIKHGLSNFDTLALQNFKGTCNPASNKKICSPASKGILHSDFIEMKSYLVQNKVDKTFFAATVFKKQHNCYCTLKKCHTNCDFTTQ